MCVSVDNNVSMSLVYVTCVLNLNLPMDIITQGSSKEGQNSSKGRANSPPKWNPEMFLLYERWLAHLRDC